MPGTMDLQTAAVLSTFDQFSYNPNGMPLPGQQMPMQDNNTGLGTTYPKTDGTNGWAADVGLGFETDGWKAANNAVFEARKLAWFAQAGRCLQVFFIAIGMSVIAGNAYCESAAVTPKDLSKPYIERQTYKEGQQSFYKDNNEWVYTPAFAKTFGMPPENVYPELKGIEAAAFRIEDPGYKLCGMGGKAENCMTQYRCVTDVYIDESKYPLPWATEQIADYHPFFGSVQWLEKSGERGAIPNTPRGMKTESWTIGWSSLHPFMDSQTHNEVFVGHNGNVPNDYPDWGCGGGVIYGYKRQVIAGLTVVSLDYGCMSRNPEKQNVTFQFRSCKKDGYKSLPLKQFHEFVLPSVFERKIDARLQEKQERDKAYYLQILNQLNNR